MGLITSAGSLFLRSYLRRVGPFLKPSFLSLDGEVLTASPGDLSSVLSTHPGSGPTIYVLWTSDHINLLSLAYASEALRSLAKDFKFFADDSAGGLVVRAVIKDIGAEALEISESDPALRLRFLRSVIIQKPTVFLAVDGRGPYFKVGTGVINLARATRSTIVPCAILSVPSWPLGNFSVSVAIPLPGSKVLGVIGKPLEFREGPEREPAETAATRLEETLNYLKDLGRERLVSIT